MLDYRKCIWNLSILSSLFALNFRGALVVYDDVEISSEPMEKTAFKLPSSLQYQQITPQVQQKFRFGSKLQFVFTVGLEETGHQLMGKLASHSPFGEILSKWGILGGGDGLLLQDFVCSLHNNEKPFGVFNSHCQKHSKKDKGITQVFNLAVEKLQNMERIAQTEGQISDTVIRVPINSAMGDGCGSSELSYPSSSGKCRKLDYPSLDLLYEACDAAEVDCGHVYLYRDPRAILKSTTVESRRNYDPLEAMHLYISMLQVIVNQLEMHGNRTMACLGLYDEAGESSQLERIRFLWGWSDDELEYKSVIEDILLGPSISDQAKDSNFTTDPNTQAYMTSLSRLHFRAIHTCQETLGNRDFPHSNEVQSHEQHATNTEIIKQHGMSHSEQSKEETTQANLQKLVEEASQIKGYEASVSNNVRQAEVSKGFQFGSKIQFVFTIGLEGTGHHLMSQITKHSPSVATLKRWKLDSSTRSILCKLYKHARSPYGLFNSHCVINDDDQDKRNRNAMERFNDTVEILRDMESRARQVKSSERILRVPINTALVGCKIQQASYPSWMSPCRKLDYPNIDLLYQACDLAKVDCGHVYVYRDPRAILKSTIDNRSFQKDVLAAVQLYISMLHFIINQLEMYSDRTLACLGFFEPPSSGRASNSSSVTSFAETLEWWEPTRRLWGWDNHSEYDSAMNKIYKPPNGTKSSFEVDEDISHWMTAFNRLHVRAIDACQRAKDNKIFL